MNRRAIVGSALLTAVAAVCGCEHGNSFATQPKRGGGLAQSQGWNQSGPTAGKAIAPTSDLANRAAPAPATQTGRTEGTAPARLSAPAPLTNSGSVVSTFAPANQVVPASQLTTNSRMTQPLHDGPSIPSPSWPPIAGTKGAADVPALPTQRETRYHDMGGTRD